MTSRGISDLQDISYAISSRTIYSILYLFLLNPGLMVYPAKLGFSWNARPVGEQGIFIQTVYPSSCFYTDPNYQDDDFEYLRQSVKKIGDPEIRDIAEDILRERSPDRYQSLPGLQDGDILLKLTIPNIRWSNRFQGEFDGEIEYDLTPDKFQEIEDSIPVGFPIKATIIREGEILEVSRKFIEQPVSRWMVRKIYPVLEPLRYLLFGGLILSESPPDIKAVDYPDRFFRKVFVTYIFLESQFDLLHLIKPGDILTHIDGKRIRTLSDISPKGPLVTFNFRSQAEITLPLEKLLREDELFRALLSV